MTRHILFATFAAASLLLLLPPPARADSGEVLVLAAASLTESLQAVAKAWTAKGHPRVTFSFDASSRLARQIEAGAPADAFFSADLEWMDEIAGRSLVDAASRVNLLGNTLVVAVPAASPLAVTRAEDLAVPAVVHLGLAGESVPAGRYGQAALTRLGVWDALSPRVVRGDNVRTVLGWVATGEVEAGVVYGTDAKVEPRVKVAWTFPESSHPSIVYPAAALAQAPHAASAREFVVWCQGDEAQRVFADAGFVPMKQLKR